MMVNIIADTQAQLRGIYGPNHYYSTKYSLEEMTYCGKVPGWIEEFIPTLGPKDSILDIGPGYGTLAAAMSRSTQAQVVAADRLMIMHQDVPLLFGLSMVLCDVEREWELFEWPLFKIVVMTEVLEHFNFHPFGTLANIRRQMATGGRLYVSTPDGHSWGTTGKFTGMDRMPHFNRNLHKFNDPEWYDGHVWHYNRVELMSVMGRAGFVPIRESVSESIGGKHFNIEFVKD